MFGLLQEASRSFHVPLKQRAKELHWKCPPPPPITSHSLPNIPLTSALSLLIYSQLLSLHSPSPFAPSSSPFVCVLWVNLLFIQGSSWHDRLMLLKLSHSAQVQKCTRNLLKWSHPSPFPLITVNAITVIRYSNLCHYECVKDLSSVILNSSTTLRFFSMCFYFHLCETVTRLPYFIAKKTQHVNYKSCVRPTPQ